VLEREGHQVADAPDGEQGLQAFVSSPPDLVITDLIMPEKEGIETIMELRRRDDSVPIVAISGESGSAGIPGPLVDAELLGADSSLEKPFELVDFLAVVKRLLADRPRRPQG